ncbi:hypothetical protein I2494_03840 [Budviciaceae bacterium BWR-B9]|uniref:Glutaconyl-CoA decarboxylase subunit gamma n=3 Tax=Limnobaculum TaxID=2172100 RepID=A0A9D7AGJ7_9GAMM|nr:MULTISPECIES: hypothetical protein [Limnobaculum]MBK5072382.1 hypothetical protein [Limnobaculum xujianqingii]MBK5142856.1 hypothetical protein [Limnobaculum allomyrinae]MBK5175691.1 hypothetical protein [Limnobaculum xujianqingii]MBV7690257.1 hypothetical protein [Limnobaculum sp. M2-1]QBH96889.1 hypothetical protein EKN56_11055 [Limnobaculum zhutongyuii]
MKPSRVLLSSVVAFSLLALSGCGEKEPAKAADNGLPAECNEYVNTITTCVNKLGKDNKAMADQFKTQMDAATESWKQMSDKEALKNSCKAAMDAFKPTLSQLGC